MGYICAPCRHLDTRFIVHQGVVIHFGDLFVQSYNALLLDINKEKSDFRWLTKTLSTAPDTTTAESTGIFVQRPGGRVT